MLAGRYRLGELLGRGGMAEVYRGTDARLGRTVAVKLLKPSLANDPAFRTRFRQEAQAAAKMAHPTIVRVFDAGEETVRDPSGIEVQVPFIVMEFVEGRLLRELVADGPTPAAEAARIVSGVLTALEYSHRAGVVHRDIKPGNIMITSSGQVKVMDFGIARAISESSATIAQTSAILGTAQYFSPEQARGESVDARTDLYSAGVVLYELLTGRAPFRADTAVAVAYQHVSEAPVPPNALVPSVSPAMNAVVLRALAKDRFERYQSAAEFRSDVEVAAAGKVPAYTAPRDDFSTTLFGVNPASGAASQETMRRLASEDADRLPRTTQSRPPVAWIWSGVAVMVVIVVSVMVWVFSLQSGTTIADAASVSVPDVAGQSFASAEKELTRAGLVVTRIDRASQNVATGNVIDTTPRAGASVSKGFTIQVGVSSGPQKVAVPPVEGQARADAIATLRAAGLDVGEVTEVDSATVAKDRVISSDPAGGTDGVQTGTKVNLQVSSGNVTVPDVRGQDVQAASDAIAAPDVGLQTSLVADRGCAGQKVTKQSVTGPAPQGTVVQLTYCSGS
ncbi:MAG: Stk1 family PASTA domain-containing Ser/Thr kinase [Micrococcales bacterium]|nr:Stk1 family PASTA domain-containing Ser/Thr kinase [Micrococcales bacterium]